jgi:hypothetical protein
MALSRDDSSRVGYRANINWNKERLFDIADGILTVEDYLKEKSTDFEATTHTPEELISILNDIQKKAAKLEDKIAFLSKNLSIPVDKVRQPEIAASVSALDSESKGEHITYDLYDKLLREKEFVNSKITANYILTNSTGDSASDSVMIHDALLNGYAEYNGQKAAEDNPAQRYLNRWMNNAISWNEHEYKTFPTTILICFRIQRTFRGVQGETLGKKG